MSEEIGYFTSDYQKLLHNDTLTAGVPYYVTITSTNLLGLSVNEWYPIKYDVTDPEVGEIKVITSSVPGQVTEEHNMCQESQTHVTVTWTLFIEDHSIIDK